MEAIMNVIELLSYTSGLLAAILFCSSLGPQPFPSSPVLINYRMKRYNGSFLPKCLNAHIYYPHLL